MLAVLALKMSHNEQYSDAEYLYEISAQKLLNQVRTLALPFHRWYGWLESRFNDLRMAHMKEMEHREIELAQWQAEADMAEEQKKSNKKGFFAKIYKFMNKSPAKE